MTKPTAPTPAQYLAMTNGQRLEVRKQQPMDWYFKMVRSPEFREALMALKPCRPLRKPSRVAVEVTIQRMVNEVVTATK